VKKNRVGCLGRHQLAVLGIPTGSHTNLPAAIQIPSRKGCPGEAKHAASPGKEPSA